MRGTLILLALAGALFLGAETKAQTLTSVTLGWTASPSSGVTGYYIYYGTSTNMNDNICVPVSNVTNVTISGLVKGLTYYFAATSHDSNYNQSAFSPEISETAGVVAQAAGWLSAAVGLPAGQFGFALSGTTGGQYVVQASTDLMNWVALQTNVAPFNFVDSNAAGFPRRFYRAVSLAN